MPTKEGKREPELSLLMVTKKKYVQKGYARPPRHELIILNGQSRPLMADVYARVDNPTSEEDIGFLARKTL